MVALGRGGVFYERGTPVDVASCIRGPMRGGTRTLGGLCLRTRHTLESLARQVYQANGSNAKPMAPKCAEFSDCGGGDGDVSLKRIGRSGTESACISRLQGGYPNGLLKEFRGPPIVWSFERNDLGSRVVAVGF